LLLRLISQREAALAEELHQREGLKPYTVSNLVMGKRSKGTLHIEAGQTGWLRLTGLSQPVSEHLRALASKPPETVEMDKHRLTVTGATLDGAGNGWAGQSSYQDLAAPYLLGGVSKLEPRVRLEFASPTTFRSKGRYLPLPLPELVFGSLLDKWQTFAPIALPPEVRTFAAEAMMLTRYQLRTQGIPYKGKGFLTGFSGQAIFTTLNRDRYWLNLLHLLADFAFYSGVGYQTSTGLGQVRRVVDVG
jgi:CRISPR-associated endoribonuclease Cas6